MILTDEIDSNEKTRSVVPVIRSDTLPPYSPSGGPGTNESLLSLSSTLTARPYPAFLHHLSASVPSFSSSRSSLSSSPSYQTFSPTSPSPSVVALHGPSAPSHSTAHRKAPPKDLLASNNVYIERDNAAISGVYIIDPKLAVPDCLLPDLEDIGKGKGRSNLSLKTKGGDILSDVWIRRGSATKGRRRRRRQSRSGISEGSPVSPSDAESEGMGEENYWCADWTAPPSSHPWPKKLERGTEISARSDSGSISLKVYAQSHERLCIRVSSLTGYASVAIPRTFMGFIYANVNNDAPPSLPNFRSGSTSTTDLLLNGIEAEIRFIAPPQPVQFSSEMMTFVTPVNEQRRKSKGTYFVGSQSHRSHFGSLGESSRADELHIESSTGAVYIYFNDETTYDARPNGLLSKFLNRPRS